VRLETIALATLVLGVAAWSCTRPEPKPVGPPPGACADLAQVVVTLTPGAAGSGQDTCRAQAMPPEVCVVQGGIVRWRINNVCKKLETRPGGPPAFEIARIVDKKTGEPALWGSEACRLQLDAVEEGMPPKGNIVLCAVPEDAEVAVYKYDVQGAEIEPLDPDIEVRRP
jgi:hypothetical protein